MGVGSYCFSICSLILSSLPSLFRISENEESFRTLSRNAMTSSLVTPCLISKLIFLLTYPMLPPYFYAVFSDKKKHSLIYRKRISLLFFAYLQNAIFSWDNYFVVPICYFASFSAQESQYFSMTIAPSTLNNASFVAMLPQLTQNFPFLPTSSKTLAMKKLFFHSIVSPLQPF